MISFRKLAPVALAAALLSGAAQAQSVMTPGAMPPPPSFRDAAPTDGQAKKRSPRKPAQADIATTDNGDQAAPRRKLRATGPSAGPRDNGLAGQIDNRPQRAPSSGGLQLEDDPRAVQPVLNNGRAGMGMRF